MTGRPLIDGRDILEFGDWHLKSQSVPRAQPRSALEDVPGRDGYVDLSPTMDGYPVYQPTTVKLVLWCRGEGDEGREASLRALLAAVQGRTVLYTPPDHGGLSWRGRCSCQVTYRSVNVLEVTATLQCDGVGYGEARSVELAEGEDAVEVGGGYPTWPRLELVSLGGPLSVSDLATGRSLALVGELEAGAAVSVDCAAKTAEAAGQAERLRLTSDWLRLVPGPTTLVLSGCSGTLSYEERWV